MHSQQKNIVSGILIVGLLLCTGMLAEGKGPVFLSKEQSYQILASGQTSLSELEGWEDYYEQSYTHKGSLPSFGPGLTVRLESLVRRGIVSPRDREQMLDNLSPNILGVGSVSKTNTANMESFTTERRAVSDAYHSSLVLDTK